MAGENPERFTAGYGGRMLAAISLGYVIMNVGRYVLPPLLPEIRADFSLTTAEAGVILTVLAVTFGFFQYPGGRLSDSWTRATVIVPSMATTVLGLVLIGVSTNLLLLVIACSVFGMGMGLYSTPSRTFLSELFEDRRGRAIGVFTAGHDLGGGIASGAAVVILAIGTWRAAFFPLAVVLAGLAIGVGVWTREPYAITRPNFGLVETGRRLFGTPEQRWAVVAFSLFYFMVTGVLFFLPTFLRDVKNFSPQVATIAFALLFVIGIVIKPGVGAISDRVSRHLVATASLLLSAAGLGLLLTVGSVVGVFAVIVLFSIGYKGLFPVIDAILLEAAPDAHMGSDFGAAKTLFQGMGGFSPAAVGYVADAYDFTVAFGMLATCLVAAALILTWQHRQTA